MSSPLVNDEYPHGERREWLQCPFETPPLVPNIAAFDAMQ